MRKRIGFPFLLVLAILTTSCASFPAENFVFDLSSSEVPVMITPIAVQARTMDFTYESGYSSKFTTVTTGTYGGYTSSTTVSEEHDLGKPLSEQIKAITYTQPPWIIIRALTLKAKKTETIAAGKTLYVLSLDLTAPLAK